MRANIDCLLVSPGHTIRQTMEVIEAAPHKVGISNIAIVVDEERRLIGVVTDGDIRSAILHDISLDTAVSEIMTADPIAVTNHSSPMKMYEDVVEMVRGSTRMLDRGAGKVLVVDPEGHLVDVISFLNLWQQADIKTRKIAVLGLGFVGLTLAVALADIGFQVTGIEVQESVVESLQKGEPHFYEAGLANQLRYHIGGRLQIAPSLVEGESDVYIVSVGTPVDSNNEPILDFVVQASHEIGKVLKRGDVVMLRSTVPVGTTRKVCLPILEAESGLKGGVDFSLAFTPERTIAGKAMKELYSLPQVIGSLDQLGSEVAAAIYREMTPTIVVLDSLEAAEMVKLVNNGFRDTIFSFANEVALVCERYGLDAVKVIEAANEGYPRDPVPLPSPGVGGVCLRKDPYLLRDSALASGFQPAILGKSREVNEYMPRHVFRKFERFCEDTGRELAGSVVFIAGFAFKGWPETSDIRDSSTLELVRLLSEKGAEVRGYDPVVSPDALEGIHGVQAYSIQEGFQDADCAIIMNNHPSYEDWNLHALLAKMRRPGLFIDGWSVFHAEDIIRAPGVAYSSLSQDKGWQTAIEQVAGEMHSA